MLTEEQLRKRLAELESMRYHESCYQEYKGRIMELRRVLQ